VLVRRLSLAASLGAAIAALAVTGGAGTLAPHAAAAIAPNTQIHGGPAGTTSSRTARFHVVATSAVRVQCKLNRGSWYRCLRSSSGYVTLRNLRSRTHTFYARGVDRAGRVDPTPARRTWRVR
jgi:hypothetical protein